LVSLEARLVAQARAGDGEAFARLVRPHLVAMHRVAGRLAGATVAEDAVQEALTLGWERLGEVRTGTPIAAFLMGFVVRRAATLARGERRRGGREEAHGAALSEERPARPDELLEARRLKATIEAGLAAMPEKRRQALVLRLDGGLSDRDIAAAIDSTEGSVRVLVHQGLAELDARLAREPAGLQPVGGVTPTLHRGATLGAPRPSPGAIP
jgi:RNA polymerase sigma-70 factor (ECF subfamily)